MSDTEKTSVPVSSEEEIAKTEAQIKKAAADEEPKPLGHASEGGE